MSTATIPEACLLAIEMAIEYRQHFHKDVFVDLVCFRRQGHNEADEPMITQPLMCKRIREHPGTRARCMPSGCQADRGDHARRAGSDDQHLSRGDGQGATTPTPPILSNYKRAVRGRLGPNSSASTGPTTRDTAVPYEDAAGAGQKRVTDVPPTSSSTRGWKSRSPIGARWARVSCRSTGAWAKRSPTRRCSTKATACAFPVRIPAAARFSHRHAVLHDQNREKWDSGTWIPLQHVKEGQPDFEMIDSVLSEAAVLGFEYGYSTSEPEPAGGMGSAVRRFRQRRAGGDRPVHRRRRSQMGSRLRADPAAAARLRGAGPEHSSARPERYLQLCAEHNMQVCVPTTPAQIFHLLRRQMVRDFRKPLIVMSPKSLLRHKEAGVDARRSRAADTSRPSSAMSTSWRRRTCAGSSSAAARSITTSLAHRRENKIADIAVIRLEQQYPFPHADFKAAVAKYPNAQGSGLVPGGAAESERLVPSARLPPGRHRRRRRCSTMPGARSRRHRRSATLSKHLEQQKQLVEDAFAAELGVGRDGDGALRCAQRALDRAVATSRRSVARTVAQRIRG